MSGFVVHSALLVPDRVVTLNYLYFAPIQWQQINTHIQDDDGNARVL